MKIKSRPSLRVLVIAALLAAAGLGVAAFAQSDEGPSHGVVGDVAFDAVHSNLDPATAKLFRDYPLYSLGPSFEGLDLRVIKHRRDPAPLPGDQAFPPADFVTWAYGRCIPAPGAHACPTPLAVQVWPSCARNLSMYSFDPDKKIPLDFDRVTIRGVPGANFHQGRIELYTGRVTIVIFGSSTAQALRAAEALRGINLPIGVDDPLPPPMTGAMEGKLACA